MKSFPFCISILLVIYSFTTNSCNHPDIFNLPYPVILDSFKITKLPPTNYYAKKICLSI